METSTPSGPSKTELLALAKGLRACEPAAVDLAVAFLAGDSRGHWHNRARAKFARRLKHCPLRPEQSRAVVDCIIARMRHGHFPEQFIDQLRLALHLDLDAVVAASREALDSPLLHVQRLAGWVVAFHGNGLHTPGSNDPGDGLT